MPIRSLRPCRYPGCAALVRTGYCETHAATVTLPQFHREWDRLYGTARWRRFRLAYLSNHPWCTECLKHEVYTTATDVDHIMPHRGDELKFWRGPFQPLCHQCHSRKTRVETGNKQV